MKQFTKGVTCTVYGLADPIDPLVIRYVGQTVLPLKKRIAAHCAISGAFHGAGDAWLLAMQFGLRKPVIYILGEYTTGIDPWPASIEQAHVNHHENTIYNSYAWQERVKRAGVGVSVIGGYTSAFFGVARCMLEARQEDFGCYYERLPRLWSVVAAMESMCPALSIMRETMTPKLSLKQIARDWMQNQKSITESSLVVSEYPLPELLLCREKSIRAAMSPFSSKLIRRRSAELAESTA